MCTPTRLCNTVLSRFVTVLEVYCETSNFIGASATQLLSTINDGGGDVTPPVRPPSDPFPRRWASSPTPRPPSNTFFRYTIQEYFDSNTRPPKLLQWNDAVPKAGHKCVENLKKKNLVKTVNQRLTSYFFAPSALNLTRNVTFRPCAYSTRKIQVNFVFVFFFFLFALNDFIRCFLQSVRFY